MIAPIKDRVFIIFCFQFGKIKKMQRNAQIKQNKKELHNRYFLPYNSLSSVHPMRIELISSEPESGILSIELRVLIKTSDAKVQIILLLS